MTPRLSPSIFWASRSQQVTSFPMSANRAPATSPTYPVPMTEIFMPIAYHEPDAMNVSVMLLAAGRSTRLGALGLTLPKPLVPICGHPAIVFGLQAAARAGATRAVVNVFHRGDLVRATLGARAAGLAVEYAVEADLLGTGGGVANARRLLGPRPALVMN